MAQIKSVNQYLKPMCILALFKQQISLRETYIIQAIASSSWADTASIPVCLPKIHIQSTLPHRSNVLTLTRDNCSPVKCYHCELGEDKEKEGGRKRMCILLCKSKTLTKNMQASVCSWERGGELNSANGKHCNFIVFILLWSKYRWVLGKKSLY